MTRVNLIGWCAALLCSAQTFQAAAQAPAPVEDRVALSDMVLPAGIEFAPVFDNVADPFHPKLVTFEADISRLDPTEAGGAELKIQFDWFDPIAGFVLRPDPPFLIEIPAGDGTVHVRESYTIPFCPELVSLHLIGDKDLIVQNGVFTHKCLIPDVTVPEGTSFGWVALLAVAAGHRLSSRGRRSS